MASQQFFASILSKVHFWPTVLTLHICTSCSLHHLQLQATAHLVGFTLAHAGAHSIHPQVGVEVVRAQACVRVHHLRHGHGHGHCSHAAAVHVEENGVTLSQKKPNPSGKQHPPHIRRATERTLKKKKNQKEICESPTSLNRQVFKKVLRLSSNCRVVLFQPPGSDDA